MNFVTCVYERGIHLQKVVGRFIDLDLDQVLLISSLEMLIMSWIDLRVSCLELLKFLTRVLANKSVLLRVDQERT